MERARSKYIFLIAIQGLIIILLIFFEAYIINTREKFIEDHFTDIVLGSRDKQKKLSDSEKTIALSEPYITVGQFTPEIVNKQITVRSNAAIDLIEYPITTNTELSFGNAHVKHPDQKTPAVSASSVPIARIADRNNSEVISEKPYISFTSVTAIPPHTFERSMVSLPVEVAHETMRPKMLTITEAMNVADVGLRDVAKSVAVTVGSRMYEVRPLPRGEPGGCIVGRGRDIRGFFRLARLKHNLADWWADQSALISFTEWLNTQTQIKTDMNVEGGAIRLTDPKLSKAPFVFFTGHDPTMVTQMKLLDGAPLRGRLSEPEIEALRRYIIEDGGFIFFDDCGVNAVTQPFLRLFMAQLRYAMPEYNLSRIPPNHEIYHNYYETGGPPTGYDIFWWGIHPSKRNFLERITVGGDLRLILSSRDYLCSMLTESNPSRMNHYSPAVYRFATNVVVYALTHGSISDYSHYIPDDKSDESIPVEKPIPVASFK